MAVEKLYIDISPTCKGKGLGLFAGIDYKKGDLIEECKVSKIRFELENDKKLRSLYNLEPVSDEHFAFEWDIKGVHIHYAHGYIGYGNHSDNPNVYLFRDIKNNIIKTYALKNIKKGDELLHYYTDAAFIKYIKSKL